MKPDTSSHTGWRVDLKGMPPLRGGIPFHPKFLNELDGFSTSKFWNCLCVGKTTCWYGTYSIDDLLRCFRIQWAPYYFIWRD
jgi:hypothetical protein